MSLLFGLDSCCANYPSFREGNSIKQSISMQACFMAQLSPQYRCWEKQALFDGRKKIKTALCSEEEKRL